MSQGNLSKRYRSLDDWFNTPVGQRVSKAIVHEIKCLNEFLYGKRLLQLGLCGCNPWLDELHYVNKWIASPFATSQEYSIQSDLYNIPFDKSSLDCVIAPFSLEILAHPSHALFEIDRVLKPMGFIVFVGINPLSMWGASLKFGYPAALSHAIQGLHSSLSTKRVLLNHDYQQYAHSSFYYLPPVTSELMISRFEFFNLIGKMLWPFPSGFYCLVMQKYSPCQTGRYFSPVEEVVNTRKSGIPISGNVITKL